MKPISCRLAAILLSLGTMLTAVNWYLRPERAAAWGAGALLLAIMTIVLLVVLRRSEGEIAHRSAKESIVNGIVFAGLVLLGSLLVKLAAALGVLDDRDVSNRTAMIFFGLFLVFTGNALPKTLTPLSALRCDVSRVQAFHRLAGWTWVLTGLAFTLIWITLPVDVAKMVSMPLLAAGMLIILTQLVRLRRTRQKEV
jgi:hypothetical protein